MDFASQNLTAGQLNAIVKKLGGEEGARRFLRGELVVSAAAAAEYPVWITVELGLFKTADDLRRELDDTDIEITVKGYLLLQGQISISDTRQELDLVKLYVADLGFKNGAKYADICAKAQELGFELCPNEVGPALRLQYTDQPRNEGFKVAMKPLVGRDGFPEVFSLGHDEDGMWLNSFHCFDEFFCHAGFAFVFVRPRI